MRLLPGCSDFASPQQSLSVQCLRGKSEKKVWVRGCLYLMEVTFLTCSCGLHLGATCSLPSHPLSLDNFVGFFFDILKWERDERPSVRRAPVGGAVRRSLGHVRVFLCVNGGTKVRGKASVTQAKCF